MERLLRRIPGRERERWLDGRSAVEQLGPFPSELDDVPGEVTGDVLEALSYAGGDEPFPHVHGRHGMAEVVTAGLVGRRVDPQRRSLPRRAPPRGPHRRR